jgi:hypothetical protein
MRRACKDCNESDPILVDVGNDGFCANCRRQHCDMCGRRLNTGNSHIWACACGWWTDADKRRV